MKPTLTLLTALLLAPLAVLHAAADTPQPAQPRGPTIYVALGGKDAAAGTQADPLASLAGARDRVRQLKQKGAADKPISVINIAPSSRGRRALSFPCFLSETRRSRSRPEAQKT